MGIINDHRESKGIIQNVGESTGILEILRNPMESNGIQWNPKE